RGRSAAPTRPARPRRGRRGSPGPTTQRGRLPGRKPPPLRSAAPVDARPVERLLWLRTILNMNSISQAMLAAAGELQRISEENGGPRGRRAAAVALVLRMLECSAHGCESVPFVARRARQEVEALG